MGLPQDLDAVIDYHGRVHDALDLVRSDWDGIIETHAAALAALPPGDDWDAYLETLTTTFQADHEPAGLGAARRTAYRAKCAVIEARAKARMVNRARELRAADGTKTQRVHEALALLALATGTSAADLEGAWCVAIMHAVHYGFLAGGARAFAAGADRDLFRAARNLARNRAADLLSVIAPIEPEGDAQSMQAWRDARVRLANYTAGLTDSDATGDP